MDCSWATSTFLERCPTLSEEVVTAIKDGSNQRYLNTLSSLALQPEFTGHVYSCFEELFPELCMRWQHSEDTPTQLAGYARILPVAPYLTESLVSLLSQQAFRNHISSTLRPDTPDSEYQSARLNHEVASILLSIFRLLSVDREVFSKCLPVAEVPLLLSTADGVVRNIALRIIALFARMSDDMRESMLLNHNGNESVSGSCDDEIFDYKFLLLFESQRLHDLQEQLRVTREERSSTSRSSPLVRTLTDEDFSPGVINICGRLLFQPPLHDANGVGRSSLVMSESTYGNLAILADAVKLARSILVTGQAGSGKTTVIDHIAEQLGKRETMVTLHLNEQSEAKLLLGVYTAGDQLGSFKWQPGVLSTAVREGRWVLIENLDRVPTEVLGLLMPLIERGEIRVPGNDETINAAMGFKLLATVRSHVGMRGEEHVSQMKRIGMCNWHRVQFKTPSESEVQHIIEEKYPALQDILPRMMSAWRRLRHMSFTQASEYRIGVNSSRPLSMRDLLKWCGRTHNALILSCENAMNSRTISEKMLDGMLLDAVDCFLGYMGQNDKIKAAFTSCIAEELHIDPSRKDFLTITRMPDVSMNKAAKDKWANIGRATIKCQEKRLSSSKKRLTEPFSLNRQTCRLMEQVAVAVQNQEAVLLVGETGIGKTSALQHMARSLDHDMLAVNFSQQSEAGDLLGGYKPVSMQSFVMPLNDEFNDLFSRTFSGQEREEYVQLITSFLAKRQWRKATTLWRRALDQVTARVSKNKGDVEVSALARREKRRKISDGNGLSTRTRWARFAANLAALESRLDRATASFAFAFVEGALVKAVRNGSWLLLDEINLASPDTLDCLSDLLEAGSEKVASLLLTETGSTERVSAHPDFRLFAAMNPSTDIGKRDLPLGIRSRLTEIYVKSPDSDRTSLESIIESHLCQSSTSQPRRMICANVANLYMRIKNLVRQGELVDGSGLRAQYSLRSLTRALSHAVAVAPQRSLKRGVYEGMAMCFSTSLDTPSEFKLQDELKVALFDDLAGGNAEIKHPLLAPSNIEVHVPFEIHIEPVDVSSKRTMEQHWLSKGREEARDSPDYIITPFIARNLRNLIRAASTRRYPVLIQGPTSAGKTSMIDYLARRSGNKFVRINNHEHTDLQEYLGTYVSDSSGQIVFQEGVLVQALRNGDWVVLDELNLAPSDVLEALNRLLDDNRELFIPETQAVIKPHPNFMLFATQNPAGAYGGRKPLSRAFQNRFLELHFQDIPVAELQIILAKRSNLPGSWCSLIIAVHRRLSRLRQEARLFEHNSYATLRDLFRWAFRGGDTVQDLAKQGYMLLAEKVRKPEEKRLVKEAIEQTMSGKGTVIQLVDEELYPRKQDRISLGETNIVWTRTMSRLYTLMNVAIRHNEPVLLVGDTGGGKTTVCQLLALAKNTSLHIVNAHQNMETSDLIGAQRPIRGKVAEERDLVQTLRATLTEVGVDVESKTSVSYLLAVYDSLDNEATEQVPTDIRNHIKSVRGHLKALFEWQDGSLVHAMRNGLFFLLDEISLAEDSVLERMNSALDPQRSILLAEKGTRDSLVVSHHGFQLFATMNPAGDFGKKELSPALRNRFTEIWVPPVDDHEDLISIVKANMDTRGEAFASVLVGFATWFNAIYGASTQGSVSVRDILSWTRFISVCQLEIEEAIVQGAMTVFIDTLGANPSGLMSLSKMNVCQERAKCLEMLGNLLEIDTSIFVQQNLDLRLDTALFAIGNFSLRVDRPTHQKSDYTFEPTTTKINAMRVMRAMQLSKPVLLEGAPGVGKTSLVTALASTTGNLLTRINLSEQTDLMDLFGSDVPSEDGDAGTFVWRDAPFLTAMKHGGWVLLDEMNLASQSVLEGLNACIDHRGEVFISELGKTFTRHPSFRLFAAQNAHHEGGGRKGLPVSFVNRFTLVFADVFTENDLQTICARGFPGVSLETIAKIVRFVTNLNGRLSERRVFGSRGSPWEFNLRDILRSLHLFTSKNGLAQAGELHDYLEIVFVERFRTPADKAVVNSLILSLFGSRVNPKSLYTALDQKAVQIGLGRMERVLHPGEATDEYLKLSIERLSLLEAMIMSLNERWPVLLVGAPEANTTELLQCLAAAAGAEIEYLAISADLDANDLIGSYEQVDPSRQVQAFLARVKDFSNQCLSLIVSNRLAEPRQRLLSAAISTGALSGEADSASGRLSACASCLQTMGPILKDCSEPSDSGTLQGLQSIFSSLKHECADLGSKSLEPAPASFEWVDGFIVKAMQRGAWLVLENANLCSSSVLDRLNSLLEVDGSLIINEHSSDDGAAKTITPHPDFRIFLTLDPQFGEISRAMRNRLVELHVPVLDRSQTRILPLEASLFGLSQLVQYCQSGTGEESLEQSLVYAVQRLAMRDWKTALEYIQQVPRVLSSRLKNCLQTICKKYEGILLDHSFNVEVQAAENYRLQSIHHLANATVSHAASSTFGEGQIFLGLRHDCLYQSAELDDMFDHMKSIHFKHSRLPGKQGSKSIYDVDVLKIAKGELVTAVHRLQLSLADASATQTLGMILQLLQILRLVVRAYFEVGTNQDAFSTYIGAIQQVIEHISNSTQDQKLPGTISAALLQLSTAKPLRTGQSMDRLWKIYKAPTPTTLTGLDTQSALEQLADAFDRAAFAASIPLAELRQCQTDIRETLILAHGKRAIDDAQMLPQMQLVVERLSRNLSTSRPKVQTHFQQAFEAIHCFVSLAASTGNAQDRDNVQEIQLLARLPTKALASSTEIGLLSRPLSAFCGYYAGQADTIDEFVDFNALLRKVFSSVNAVGDIALRRFTLLQDEVRVLGKYMATLAPIQYPKQYQALRQHSRSIVEGILSAHHELLIDPRPSEGKAHLQLKHDLPGDHYFRTTVNEYLENAYDSNEAEKETPQTWYELGCQLVNSAVGSLYLYVPDRAYDPAQQSLVERWIHQQRVKDVDDQIAGLSRVESFMTGQTVSLRTELLAKDLKALGPAPEEHVVLRPQVSRLPELHGEFTSILRVVNRTAQAIREERLEDLARSGIIQNISSIVHGLSNEYKSYEDITKIAVGFLRCLALGLQMVSQFAPRQISTPWSSIGALGETPFIKADLTQWTRGSPHLNDNIHRQPTSELEARMRLLAFRAQVENPSVWPIITRETLFEALQTIYEDWKQNLKQRQEQEAKASSLYRYRGGEDVQDEADEAEFLDLFPAEILNIRSPSDESAQRNKYNAQAVACRMARLHQDIFLGGREVVPQMLELFKRTSTMLGQQDPSDPGAPQTYRPELLMPLLLSLQQQKRDVCFSARPGKAYNIYIDPNVSEALRLRDLIASLQERTRRISAVWPEHATLHNIAELSEELLMSKHSQAIANFFTKVEQVHGYIAEWQTVASREYSLVDHYDNLTRLIVNWRQMELSTWARLLEIESEASDEEAHSWWFVAYENIIAIPSSFDASASEMQDYIVEITTTVESLLRGSSVGQYDAKLKIITALAAHLDTMFAGSEVLNTLARALGGLMTHYRRFSSPIMEKITEGRSQLQREVKNIIQMASWKDTNIVALRQSAKASHRKLFTIIRKYRKLLRMPAEPFLSMAPSRTTAESATELSSSALVHVDDVALRVCQSQTDIWSTRPPRFRNVRVTTNAMMDMCGSPTDADFDASVEMKDYVTSVEGSVKKLRRATPSLLTEDNSAKVKHLSQQKRSLLAGTLRDIRQMGIRPTQKADLAKSQDSLARILVSNTLQDTSSTKGFARKAAENLHAAIDDMSQIRLATREHHPDLTPSDVNRAVGMIEGLLALSLKQRNALVEFETRQWSLCKVVQKARSVWRDHQCQVAPISHYACKSRVISQTVLKWLPEMIKIAIQLLSAQGECGDCDFSSILDSLAQYASRFETLRDGLRKESAVAEGLTSLAAVVLEQEHKAATTSLEGNIGKWTQSVPVTHLILNQLLRWTRFDDGSPPTDHVNGAAKTSLEIFNSELYAVLDRILGSIQDVRTTMASCPSGHEDKDWLTKSSTVEAAVIGAFRAPLTSSNLESVLASLQHIEQRDSDSFKIACASLTLGVPIIEQYMQLYQTCLSKFTQLHYATTRLLFSTSTIFKSLASQGFCKPSEKSEESGQGKEKLESGTGLGEGEGADDISKDIEADEDLSELAQDRENAGSNDDQDADDANKDAVDIDGELQGGRGGAGKHEAAEDGSDAEDGEHGSDRDLADAGEGGDDTEGQSGGEEGSAMDEGAGDVDDRYPSAADEKLWDEAPEKDTRLKETDQKASTKDDDQHGAGTDCDGVPEDNHQPAADGDEGSADGSDEDEGNDTENSIMMPEEAEPMDPHVHQSEGLDLPDELNLDGEKDARKNDDDSDVDMMSDEEDEEEAASENEAEGGRPLDDIEAITDDFDQVRKQTEGAADDDHQSEDVISEDDQNEDVATEDTTQDSSLRPYAEQEIGDSDTDPTGTAQGTEGTDTVAGVGQADQAQTDVQQEKDPRQEEAGVVEEAQATDESQPSGQGRAGQSDATDDPLSQPQSEDSKLIKQVGDMARQFYRRQQRIREQTSNQDQGQSRQNDIELGDADFEHLPDDDAEADAQALGAASEDQAHPIDDSLALPGEHEAGPSDETREDFLLGVDDTNQGDEDGDIEMEEGAPVDFPKVENETATPSATIGKPTANEAVDDIQQDTDLDMPDSDSPPTPEITNDIQTLRLQAPPSDLSPADLWAHHTAHTLPLSQLLTEQLRLVLAPTLATKLRGGHRTGKRLNLKAIIPYMASSYKRDKIWLRRSYPSKRTYQIQLALDDSKSMAENGSSGLAFATLALVARALTMLESGEVGVLGFGREVLVAHELGVPFTGESGAEVVGRFGFEQTVTDVKALVRESIDIFRDARRRSQNASDLWQLQLVISDGICEDHAGIGRLLLEAKEERIMFIFVIVDAAAQQNTSNSNEKTKTPSTTSSKKQSITDLLVAEFKEGPKGPDGEAGETKIVRRRYMDTFPFPYYLIVQDVQDLPDVLSAALRQWFAEVSEV